MPKRPIPMALVALAILVTGCGGGNSESDPVAAGRDVYGEFCSACHGSAGQGGAGPALASVMEVWPSCVDQVEWIALGSEGWRDAHGDTYGATDNPLKGGMPGLESRLTPDQIRQVAAYQRSAFGGQDPAEALADCGATTG